MASKITEFSGRSFLNTLVITTGLVLAFALLAWAVKDFAKDKRYVEVKGLAEKIFQADEVYWPITFEVVETDKEAFNKKVARDIEVTKKMLLEQGIAANDITVQPLRTNVYMNGAKGVETFNGRVTISVYSTQVDLVKKITEKTADLLAQGVMISGWENPQYFFTTLNEVKPALLAEATKNARQAATEFAEESESQVGKIAMAKQGMFSISEKDPGSPEQKRVRVVSTIRFFLD